MRLDRLLDVISISFEQAFGVELTDLTIDSREVQAGSLFIALKGLRCHGMDYVDVAIADGAAAVLYDDWSGKTPTKVPVLRVPQLRQFLGRLAQKFFSDPCEEMQIIGITGTNGKTTTAHLIAQLAESIGIKSACIGTLGMSFGTKILFDSERTTPDAITLARCLSRFSDSGVKLVAMEVSSHAIDQERVGGIPFSVAVFTNLSRDHLDYHKSMEAYGETKARLFTENSLKYAIVNMDDEFGRRLAARIPDSTLRTFGRKNDVSCRIVDIRKETDGCVVDLIMDDQHCQLYTSLLGDFNGANLIAALLAIHAIAPAQLVKLLKATPSLRAVPGRMESFKKKGFATVIVDYAHTPDALKNALHTCRTHCRGDVWSVFGCGGDRDQGKRELMGQVASDLSDHVVLTTDNPRSEPEIKIINQIRKGMTKEPNLIEMDRIAAIRFAISNAKQNDWILVAGKGHESTQTIGTVEHAYSDIVEVSKILGSIDSEGHHASVFT